MGVYPEMEDDDLHPKRRKSRPEVMRMIAMRLLPLSSRNFMMGGDVQNNE
jgi:hypothetical protein